MMPIKDSDDGNKIYFALVGIAGLIGSFASAMRALCLLSGRQEATPPPLLSPTALATGPAEYGAGPPQGLGY